MWPKVVECIQSELNIRCKLSYLNTVINVYNLKLESENEINFVKKKIKDHMTDGDNRLDGLLLLYSVVHSDSTVYIDTWSQVFMGSLKCIDSSIPREIPLKVMNRMIINFANNLDHAPVFTVVVPEFLSFLLDSNEEKLCKLSYQSLAICMKYVPDLVTGRLEDIEKLLLKELSNPYGEIIEAVGECFAALPLCTLRFKRISLGYKDMWCQIFTKILNTVNFLLNSLLKLPEDQEEYLDVSELSVFPLGSLGTGACSPVSLSDVFKSLCQCMAKMMSSESCFVHIPVSELLKTLNRIFRIEKIIKRHDQNGQTEYFMVGLPQMINGAYIVLEALILNLNIFEQSYNFVILITMSLKSMGGSFSKSSVSQVRSASWKLVNIWLKQYGSKGSYQVATDRTILQEILSDISIDEKQLNTDYSKEKENTNKILTCTYALKVLKSLFETSCCYMEKDSIDKICIKLLRISKIVLKRISPKTFPFPYSDEKCRKMLFDVLHNCALYSDPLHSRCILEAQNIFNAASRDTSAKVRRICYRFRKLSRYYLNPRKPPPNATQYSNPGMLNIQQSVIEHARSAWEVDIEFNNANGPSSDDQMDDSEVAHVQGENAYSDRMERENDLMPIEQESESHMNHDYRANSKQSSQTLGEEESIDDSDIEPTYISTDSNPQRIGLNDSSRINSFGIQSCKKQYANETRTERHTSESIVPNFANSVENNIEEHIFVEVKSAQNPPQVPVENGDWRKENNSESEEDESDMDEEGDEEGEANEEVSGCDEASDGKHSPEFDEERPSKRQKFIDEEEDDNEDIEDEDIQINNQSSSEEENEGNTVIALEESPGSNSENQLDEDDNTESGSPSFREMCDDFVLAEPAASEIS